MEGLNESHRRRILLTLLGILQGMADMQALMDRSGASSAASDYDDDLSPTQNNAIQDLFARIHAETLAALGKLGIPLEKQRTSLRWHMRCQLTSWHISLAELSPSQLRAYGPVGKPAGNMLQQVQEHLDGLMDGLEALLV